LQDASAALVEQAAFELPAQAPVGLHDAFISYRHTTVDNGWALWLHRALEGFRTPQALVARGIRKRLTRVFRDEDELHASPDLREIVFKALHESRFLIVICSPRSATSEWVNKEVAEFIELDRRNLILPLLIEGEPDQAFPPALRVAGAAGLIEPLAADVRDATRWFEWGKRRRALLKLLAPILGCSFDDLLQREQERTKWRRAGLTAGVSILAVIAAGLGALTIQRQVFELVSHSQDNVASDPSLSLLLSHLAFKKSQRMLGIGGDVARTALENALAKNRLRAQFDLQPDKNIRALAWHTSGLLAAGGAYGSVRIWERKSSTQQIRPIGATGTRIDSLAFGPGSSAFELAIGDGSPVIRIANIGDNKVRELRTGRAVDDTASLGEVSWCRTDGRLAVTNGSNAALIFDLKSKAPPTKIGPDDRKPMNVVAWNRECTALAMGGESDGYLWRKDTSSVKKLNIQGPTPVNAPSGRKGTLALAWHRDGLTFASGGQDGSITVTERSFLECQICDSTKSMLLGSHDRPVFGLAWGGPHGSQLASAGLDGSVRIWTQKYFSDRHPLQTIITHQQGSWSVAWSPDGEELASGGGDGTIKIWRISEEPEQIQLSGRIGLLIVLGPENPNGPQKLVLDKHPLNNSQLSELASQRSIRTLTSEECKRYLQTSTCPALQ